MEGCDFEGPGDFVLQGQNVTRRAVVRRIGQYGLLLVLLAVGLPRAAGAPTHGTVTLTVCPSGCDSDTIQGALNAATDGDTIQLLFTSPHTEFDIVIDKNVSIVGLGVSNTIVQAAASPGTAPNRVFFVTSGLTVHLYEMTIRYGVAGGDGGALYNQGSDITLEDVHVLENEATNGGGIYGAGGTLTLNRVLVNDNTVGVHGGGVFSAGTLNVTDSDIVDNGSGRGGGGLYNSGTATIRDSNVNSNQVPFGNFVAGGGIYSAGILSVIDSTISVNEVGGSPDFDLTGGGGIYISDGELLLLGSTVSHNTVGENLGGAGLFLLGGEAMIDDAVIHDNQAVGIVVSGGGVQAAGGNLVITDTTIRDNESGFGGGIRLDSAAATIRFSTIHGNNGLAGGGLYVCDQSAEITLTNVTISGNQVPQNGGGIYVCATGEISLANVTISDNTADSDGNNSGNGGGIFLSTVDPNNGTAHLRNTLIAGNRDLSTLTGARAHDCFGELNSEGYNLIGTLGFQVMGTPCSVAGDPTGNQIGVDAMLDVLANNGGPTWTHALLPGSPAIDAGDPAGCTDPDGGPNPTDQRHGLRLNRCDGGAFELGALTHHSYLAIILR